MHEEPTTTENGVSSLVMDYLRVLDDGGTPDLAEYERRLPDEPSRCELRELVAAARWARAQFPLPFRADVVIDRRYRLIRQIGSGGFGKVWLAEDQKLRREVAVKVTTALADAEHAAKSLRHEVDTMARLSHRGIVRLLDSGTYDGSCYLVMEHVVGKSLEQLLDAMADGPTTAERIRTALGCPRSPGESNRIVDDWPTFGANVMVEVLWALGAAHGNGVVHRDLKPANIMLTGDGRPVLLDFGIAGLRDQEAGTITKGLFGTTQYLAPEQLTGRKSGKLVSVDVYQAGLILFELLTRRRAFAADTHEELVRRIVEGDCKSPRQLEPTLPRALEDIVLRAIARDPGRRYATADQFRTDLERWLEGAVPIASGGGNLMRLARSLRQTVHRRRRPLALLAAVLIGGLPAYFLQARPALARQSIDLQGLAVVHLDAVATVVPLGVWADAAGVVHGYQPGVIVRPEGRLHSARLAEGEHRLQLALRHSPDSAPPGTQLQMLVNAEPDAEKARSVEKLLDLVEAEARHLERPLRLDEIERLQRTHAGPGRGGGAETTVDLARLLGDGTLASFRLEK